MLLSVDRFFLVYISVGYWFKLCSKKGVAILFTLDTEEFRTKLKREMADVVNIAIGIRLGYLAC
jgi:hypothetical protein